MREIVGDDLDIVFRGEELRHSVHDHVLAALVLIGLERLDEIILVLSGEYRRLGIERRRYAESIDAVTGDARRGLLGRGAGRCGGFTGSGPCRYAAMSSMS